MAHLEWRTMDPLDHAVLLAAGEGSRLRPLTDHVPKPLLPIDGRPVLATTLRELAGAPCERVTVVVGHLGDQIVDLLGDGRGYGVEVAIAWQPRPDGSADAVRCGLGAGAHPPLLIVTADTVFRHGDVARFARAFSRSGAPGAAAVRREPPPDEARAGVEVADGRVQRIVAARGTAFAHASLWGFDAALLPYLEGLDGPPYELAQAYQRAIDDGLHVAALEV